MVLVQIPLYRLPVYGSSPGVDGTWGSRLGVRIKGLVIDQRPDGTLHVVVVTPEGMDRGDSILYVGHNPSGNR